MQEHLTWPLAMPASGTGFTKGIVTALPRRGVYGPDMPTSRGAE